jgi:hypothetical protein
LRSFGNDTSGFAFPASQSGDLFGFSSGNSPFPFIFAVSPEYASGSLINALGTYNSTFAFLGLVDGSTFDLNWTNPETQASDALRICIGNNNTNCPQVFTGESVPGPLPVLGAAAAFGFSRKLRKRIKSSKLPVASAIY